MSANTPELSTKIRHALSSGGAVIASIANPVNLLFVALLVMAGFALLHEQMILVGIISTLALLTGALGAGLLAMYFVSAGKTLSPRGFALFLGLAFIGIVALWSIEIFNNIPGNPWPYVAELAAIVLVSSLYLVPRLRDAFRAKGIMAQE